MVCRSLGEWQLADLFTGNDGSCIHSAGIECESRRNGSDHCGHTNFQLHVERQPVGHANLDAVANGGVEVFLGDGELILAGRQQREAVGAVFAGARRVDDAGFDVFDFDFAAGNDGTVWIGDFTGE